MKSKNSVLIAGLTMSLLLLASPAYARSSAHSASTSHISQRSATLAEFYLMNSQISHTASAIVDSPTTQVSPAVPEQPVVTQNPVRGVSVLPTSPPAVVTQPSTNPATPVVSPPASAEPPPEVITSAPAQEPNPSPEVTAPTPINTPNGSNYAPNGNIWCSLLSGPPALGQSCQLPEATTDYSMPTSVVYAPNTLSFTAVPSSSNVVVDTSGNYVYTPTFASGSPDAGQITVTASGSCSSNGTTVVFTGTSCSVTISQQGAAPVTQVIQVQPASTQPQ